MRTAESAVRRLIVAAARDIVVEPQAQASGAGEAQDFEQGQAQSRWRRQTQAQTRLPVQIVRPAQALKKSGRRPKRPEAEPRITVIDYDPRIPFFLRPHSPQPRHPFPRRTSVDDDTVNARHLIRRLLAITDALHDIPRQARRLALWRAQPNEERRPERWSPLRVGRPPGFRQRPIHEVDEILKECHWLARNAEPAQFDTS